MEKTIRELEALLTELKGLSIRIEKFGQDADVKRLAVIAAVLETVKNDVPVVIPPGAEGMFEEIQQMRDKADQMEEDLREKV